jgi:hypothetical protein
MLYNRCTDICKFGNNTYPWRKRCRSNLGHIFRGKKVRLMGREIRYSIKMIILQHPQERWTTDTLIEWEIRKNEIMTCFITNIHYRLNKIDRSSVRYLSQNLSMIKLIWTIYLWHNPLPSKLQALWSHLHQSFKSTKPDLLLNWMSTMKFYREKEMLCSLSVTHQKSPTNLGWYFSQLQKVLYWIWCS